MISTEEKAQAFARRMTDYLNDLGNRSVPALIDALSREHRTLQQGVTRFCVAWFEHLSKLEQHQYNARNESSVLLARKFVERIDTYERHLPTI